MIIDSQTNKVYLARGLGQYHPLAEELIKALTTAGIDFAWLPRTERREHVWAREYMPIQLEKNLFLQYQYQPDYLKEYRHFIPDYREICADLGLNCIKTDIILDGGNVIKCGPKMIMTDKIFKENPQHQRCVLVNTLENLFSAELVIIPWDRFEMFGHADGMVRYVGSNQILLNNYINLDPYLRKRLLNVLSGHFDVKELNYSPGKMSWMSWAFLNFLQVKNCIFVPMLPILEQHDAQFQLQAAFPDYKICFINGAEAIVKEGGALNCVSWNILADATEKTKEEI